MFKGITIRLNAFRTAFLLSVLVHLSVLLLSSFSAVVGEIDPGEYKLVQLMDLTPAADRTPVEGEGELRVSDDQKDRKQDFPKEEDLSLYLPFFKVARLPEFTVKIRPEYPPSAKLRAQESEVLVEVYIDDTGRVRKVSLLKSGGEDFDRSVLSAVSRSAFRPAIDTEGRPVACRVRIPFKFELE